MIAAVIASCVLMGAGQTAAPDNRCTPGEYENLTRGQACTPDRERYIPVAVKRAVLARYGIAPILPFPGKFDHRHPNWYGGTETIRNVWPAPVRTFDKDRLESLIRRRVCLGEPYPMRLETARRIFAADWRPAYRYYVLGRGTRP
jgi:hypothetical protein